MTEQDKRAAIIAGHRHAADLMEKHPTIAAPFVIHDGTLMWTLYAWSNDCPDGVAAMVATIRRAIGGKWDKRESGDSTYSSPEMHFEREGYRITCKRDAVCTRRVVETKTVVKPAVSLPERTEIEEVVEWDCDPILAAEATA